MLINKKLIIFLLLIVATVFLISGCEKLLGFYNVTVKVTDFDGDSYSKDVKFKADGDRNRKIDFTVTDGNYSLKGLQGEVTIEADDSAYIVEPEVLTVTPEDSDGVLTFETRQIAPLVSPAPGTYTEPPTIEMSYEDGYTIYYTLNGNDPVVGNSDTHEYSSPITLSQSSTIKAVAVDNNNSDNKSNIYSGYYSFPEVVLNETFEGAVIDDDYIYDAADPAITSIKEHPASSGNYYLKWAGNNKAVGLKLNEGVDISADKKIIATAKIKWLGTGNINWSINEIALGNDSVGYGIRYKFKGDFGFLKFSSVPNTRDDSNYVDGPAHGYGEMFTIRLEWEYDTFSAYIDDTHMFDISTTDYNDITVDRILFRNYIANGTVTDILIDEVKVEVLHQ